MGIEEKHTYRFEYLKSEKWQTVRLEALVREHGKCQICFSESIHNDCHHMWYPENIWDTTASHLIVLCRSCHGFVHEMVPQCKTNDESEGRQYWNKFQNAIIAWRASHIDLFQKDDGIPYKAPDLREAYKNLKKAHAQNKDLLLIYQTKFGLIPEASQLQKIEEESEESMQHKLRSEKTQMIKKIEQWFDAYMEKRVLTKGQ